MRGFEEDYHISAVSTLHFEGHLQQLVMHCMYDLPHLATFTMANKYITLSAYARAATAKTDLAKISRKKIRFLPALFTKPATHPLERKLDRHAVPQKASLSTQQLLHKWAMSCCAVRSRCPVFCRRAQRLLLWATPTIRFKTLQVCYPITSMLLRLQEFWQILTYVENV